MWQAAFSPQLIWKGSTAVSVLVDLGNHWQLTADTALPPYFSESTLCFNIRTKEGAKSNCQPCQKNTSSM